MWWRSWLRHCPKIPKVVGLIPNGDHGIFHCLNSSDRTMTLESTQSPTEMSTSFENLITFMSGLPKILEP